MKKKVFIGFSGGIDSSVAAYILKQKKYDVTAVFMTNISPKTYAGKCMQEELENAKTVAKFLNIPFITIDLQDIFKETVEKRFYNEYLLGNTPNPCIECNKLIKFGELAEKCFELGADYFATGHYAKTKKEKLLKPKDSKKDQTYFLNRISEEVLEKTLFPLQSLKKEQVRKIAEDINLPNFNKKDSQKICFLKGKKISELFDSKQGDIVDIDSKENVGIHDGIFNYTIGQRQGVKIGGLDQPYFVAKKDVGKNILYVAKGRDNSTLWKSEFFVKDFNFINFKNQYISKNLKGVIRYHSKETDIKVDWKESNNTISGKFTFKNPQWAPSTGQSLVVYKGNECIGGGEITTILD